MRLKTEELEKELKEGRISSMYLFYGEETYLLEAAVKKIKTLFGQLVLGINYIVIDSNIDGIISDIQTPAFGYEKKLIIVKNANLFKKEAKKKTIKNEELSIKIDHYINNNIEDIKESNVIIFIEQEVDKNELLATIEKHGVVCDFERLKPSQLVKRLKAICNAYQVNVDENTLTYLVDTVGTNMQDLINEIRKLIEYTAAGGTIKKEDIDKLSTKHIETVIFDLIDTLGNKNIQKSIEILNRTDI
jgi:DNA polymerase-3 subunit delta